MFLIWNSITEIKFIVPMMHRQICLQDRHNSHFSYLHMEPETSLIFMIKSSLVNLNSRTKFECFLYIKLLEKGIYILII